MKCTRCGRLLKADREDCPECGEPVIYKLEKSHNTLAMIFAAILTVGILIVTVVILFGKGDYTLRKEALSNEIESVFSNTDSEYVTDWDRMQDEEIYEETEEGSVFYPETTERTVSETAETYSPPVQQADEPMESRAVATDNPFDQWEGENPTTMADVPEDIERFYQSYRSVYSDALNELDFDIVAPYLSPQGTAFDEMRDYIEDIKDYGNQYNFYENEITNYHYDQGVFLYLETYEAFYLIKPDGQSEAHERDKWYMIVLDEYGEPESIHSIEITDYYR